MADSDGTAPPGPGLDYQWRAEAVFVGGPKAWSARLGFLRNPVRAVEDCHRRFGPVVAFTASGPRLTSIRHLLLIGPTTIARF
jgi:hypothetical protein